MARGLGKIPPRGGRRSKVNRRQDNLLQAIPSIPHLASGLELQQMRDCKSWPLYSLLTINKRFFFFADTSLSVEGSRLLGYGFLPRHRSGAQRLLAGLERFHLELNDVRRGKKVKSPIEGYAQAPLPPWKGEQVVSSPGEPGQKSREPHTPDSTHTSMSA